MSGILISIFKHIQRVKAGYNYIDYIIIVLFAFSATFFIRRSMDLMMRRYWIIPIIIICLMVLLLISSKYRKKKSGRLFLFSSIPIVLFIVYTWFIDTFGAFDFGAILFHAQMGIDDGSVDEIIGQTVLYVGMCALLLFAAHRLARRDIWLVRADRLCVLPLLVISPFISNVVNSYAHADDGDVLVTHYQAPIVKREAGLPFKNIIIINAESAESTFGEIANGDDNFGHMKAIAAQGLSFKGVRQAANTGWTIAGLVSSQCGVPLQPNGLFAVNKFETQASFMPGANCLGDVLTANGYVTSYVASSATTFAGTNKFLSQHNYQSIAGSEHFKDLRPDYRNFWGFYDDTMFGIAAQKLDELRSQKQPFLLSISTISGHFPHGFPTESCINAFGPNDGQDMVYAMKCTGFEIDRFLEQQRAAGHLENTIVVVMSDHLSMKSSAWAELNSHDRMNYLTILGTERAPGVINKDAATFDIFPTILDVLGFELQDQQAGVGISLLSDKPTLVEQIGMPRLDDIIVYDRELRQRLWQPSLAGNLAAGPVIQ